MAPGPGPRQSSVNDGALLREQSHPEVYVVFGHARFHISSPEEMTALGYNWGQVKVVPDGSTAPLARVPDAGTLLRERAGTVTWVSTGDALRSLGTSDAVRFLQMGSAAGPVRIVPASSLGGMHQVHPDTVAKTPPSVVFPPDNYSKWPRPEVPGYSLPNGSHVTELRGWLRHVDGRDANPDDPDWHIDLEVDPAWLDHLGANWQTFFKVGDILKSGFDAPQPISDPPDFTGVASTPVIHVEFNGWDVTYSQPYDKDGQNLTVSSRQHRYTSSVAAPADWTTTSANGGPTLSTLPHTVWPYRVQMCGGGDAPLAVGSYVRVVGSVVSDIPHINGRAIPDWFDDMFHGAGAAGYARAARDWAGNVAETDQSCRPRWTEIHPPDLVDVPSDQSGGPAAVAFDERPERVWGVAVVAATAPVDTAAARREYRVHLDAPPRPPQGRLKVQEYVTPDTRYQSIVVGNANHTGASITPDATGAWINVGVEAAAFNGSSGRFAAIYRMSWDHDASIHQLKVTQDPRKVQAGEPVTITFHCVEAGTDGPPIDGTVSIGSIVFGGTNQTISSTFDYTTEREWVGPEPGDPTGPHKGRGHWVTTHTPPTVSIDCPGFPTLTLTVELT